MEEVRGVNVDLEKEVQYLKMLLAGIPASRNTAPTSRPTPFKFELPVFKGEIDEDALSFLRDFERASRQHEWDEATKLKFLYSALKGNASDWHEAKSKSILSWDEMRDSFLETFGGTLYDADLNVQARYDLERRDPMAFVSRITRRHELIDTTATEAQKTVKLIESLSPGMKIHFRSLKPQPTTVTEFTNELKQAVKLREMKEEADRFEAVYGRPSAPNTDRAGKSSACAYSALPLAEAKTIAGQLNATVKNTNFEEQIKALQDQITRMQTRPEFRSGGGGPPRFSGGPFRDRNIECHHCKKQGHIKKNCYTLNGFPQRAQRPNGPRAPAPTMFANSYNDPMTMPQPQPSTQSYSQAPQQFFMTLPQNPHYQMTAAPQYMAAATSQYAIAAPTAPQYAIAAPNYGVHPAQSQPPCAPNLHIQPPSNGGALQPGTAGPTAWTGQDARGPLN